MDIVNLRLWRAYYVHTSQPKELQWCLYPVEFANITVPHRQRRAHLVAIDELHTNMNRTVPGRQLSEGSASHRSTPRPDDQK